MLFDSLILAAVTREFRQSLTGAKVDRITQPTAGEILIRLHHRGSKDTILLSCDAAFARVHHSTAKRDNPTQPTSFCMLLRKHLAGARLSAITIPHGFGERIMHLEFQAFDGATYTLVAELMGKHSNIILITQARTILGAVKHIGLDRNRYREIAPGKTYVMPPVQGEKRDVKSTPLNPPLERGEAGLDSPSGEFLAPPPSEGWGWGEVPESPTAAAKWLVATFAGVSPLLAREIVQRTPPPFSDESLSGTLRSVVQEVEAGRIAPIIWTDDRGVMQGAYPIGLSHIPARNQHGRPTMSEALDQAAESMRRSAVFEQQRKTVLGNLARAVKQAEHERIEIQRGLENAARAPEYQECGDLLLAHYHMPADGADTVTVPDLFRMDGSQAETPMREIAVDPATGLRENAERYYKKARKARDSQGPLAQRLAAAEARLVVLIRLESAVAESKGTEELDKIAAELAKADPRARLQPAAEQSGKHPARATPNFGGHKIKSVRSAEGWEILLGETATANDYLTTKVASPSDIWLHVRAATSAHGVIRTQNRPMSVPHSTLVQAAGMVAARSQVKHSSLIPVDYVLKKYVRKPRKSAPGSVTYQNEKTLYVSGIDGD